MNMFLFNYQTVYLYTQLKMGYIFFIICWVKLQRLQNVAQFAKQLHMVRYFYKFPSCNID